MNLQNNPFSGLLSSGNVEIPPAVPHQQNNIDSETTLSNITEDEKKISKFNSIVEDVFFFTINDNEDRLIDAKNNLKNQLVFLEEWASASSPKIMIDFEMLEQVLFDRLLLENPSQYTIPKGCKKYDKHVIETDVLIYLYSSSQNIVKYINSNDNEEILSAKKIRDLILRNTVTALKQPDLFSDQMLCDQLFYILKTHYNDCHPFINDVVNEFMADDMPDINQLRLIIVPLMKLIQKDILKASLVSLDAYIFPALFLFTSNTHLSTIFLNFCKPNDDLGRSYQDTILGGLLSLSVLPKHYENNFEYFERPLDKTASNILEGNLWSSTDGLINNLHKIFLSLLKQNSNIKNSLLEWIGNCLHSNMARGKMWNVQTLTNSKYVSDGFMLNLSNVLLMLCQPFCSTPNNPKSLKIDPTYCAVEENERIKKNVHMKEMNKETCIIPQREANDEVPCSTRKTAQSYNFVTECFFMTHKALDLGYRVIVEKMVKLSQSLNNTRHFYSNRFGDEINDPSTEIYSYLNSILKGHIIKIISMKCVLREPQSVSLLANLHAATCNWLVQLAIHGSCRENPDDGLAPMNAKELVFPLLDEEPDALRCVPEFLIENIIEFMSTNRLLKPLTMVDQGAELLEPILTVVLVYMGDSKKMRNPHLRARLAECLATLLPVHEHDDEPMNSISVFVREKLFKEHPHRLQIVPSLLNVFVGIEVTGESVQFEQKFHYRRPMYIVMDYLWEMEEHRSRFKQLSEEAESNMEAVSPPIFLRFINLLMNDAVFLLDEALSNMTQIRNMQSEMGNTEHLSNQNYADIRHVGMIARFDNILGRHTIETLEKLTSKIKSIFCHSTMVDRIAAMLNYFLLHLVGPNRKNFKVKDSKEYEFDPVSTVLNICRIYIHLGENSDFCAAISNDGRSYSPQLFKLAEDVLARIQGGGELISALREIASKVSQLAARRLEEEEIFGDIPEEFLDPIMSTLMNDPVVLPSSKITIDRTTIARHLLSDQSDPFNRSPLTMDLVKPDDELRTKIQKWMEEKRKA